MGIEKIKDKYLVYKLEYKAEAKFRNELSKQLISKFGRGPFEEEDIRAIVLYSVNYYIAEFLNICHSETSCKFYQQVFIFHEQATELSYVHNEDPTIDWSYIASYRRTLKFVLETGCEINMVTGESFDANFQKRFEATINDLLFLGEMILTCVSLYAEQGMVEDLADVSFDENNLYVFGRRHHYNHIIKYIIGEFNGQVTKAIIDDSDLAGFSDLKNTIKKCFTINYDNVSYLLAAIHEQNKSKGGYIVGVEWRTLTANLNGMFGVPLESAEEFFQGLKLDRNNKMSLLDLACKPYNLIRYIYRPILIWNVDGSDYAFFGKSSWSETFIQLSSNAIPWGKAAPEWLKNKCFKTYVHTKEDDHDRWLDDEVEKKLETNNYKYDRNVKSLFHGNTSTNIDVKGLGEVDFIIINSKRKIIYVSDCKHLLGRYDMMNQKNDFNAFSVGEKSYNKTMERKVDWFSHNHQLVAEHFGKKYKEEFDFTDYKVEGIFIINTPTFYMYNAHYRIYTVAQLDSFLKGTFIDKTFEILIEGRDDDKFLHVQYPYFKKPNYLIFDPFIDIDV